MFKRTHHKNNWPLGLIVVVTIVSELACARAEPVKCSTDDDCDAEITNRICFDNKCICHKGWPVEHKDRAECLQQRIINQPCQVDEQCLGESQCIDQICSCPESAVKVFNPSTGIDYCHPKRRLEQECSYDVQCPENAFCSTRRFGCLCQNGYGPQTVSHDGNEILECLPKVCSKSSDCESEFHQCDENKCKCLATHFNPHTAGCYRFGATVAGQSDEDMLRATEDSKRRANVTSISLEPRNNDGLWHVTTTFFKDLTKNSDRNWLVIMLLILLTLILVLALVLLLAKRHQLAAGCCWTAHKKEYEPNSPAGTLLGGSKSSINNKSFRRKAQSEFEPAGCDEDDQNTSKSTGDKSSLVAAKSPLRGGAKTNGMTTNGAGTKDYVKVDFKEDRQPVGADCNANEDKEERYQPFHQRQTALATSTSTPV